MSRTTETVSLLQGDDLATMADLLVAAEAAQMRYDQAARLRRLGSDNGAAEAEAAWVEYNAFVDEATARATDVVVATLGKKAFRGLRLEFPPRKVEKVIDGETTEVFHDDDVIMRGDGFVRVNTDEFPEKLLTYVSVTNPAERTILEPTFATPAELIEWLDSELTEGQFDSLWQTAFNLNSRGAIDPKALRHSSPATKTSDATSGSPAT